MFELIFLFGLAYCGWLGWGMRRNPDNWEINPQSQKIAFTIPASFALVCLIGAVCVGLLLLGVLL